MSADIVNLLRWLSGLCLVTLLLLLTPDGDAYQWANMTTVSALFVVIAAALGVAASMGKVELAVIAGIGLLLGAIIQFASIVAETPGVIGGNASTMSLLAGLGLGFLVLGLADRIPQAVTSE